jgi:hypothetical protein
MTKKPKTVIAQKGRRLQTPKFDGGSTNNGPPFFSFRFHKAGADYCLHHCDRDQKAAFVDKLYILGQQTWRDIVQTSHLNGGCELIPITQMRPKQRPAGITDDVDKLLVFRFNSDKCRFAGFRDGAIFYIVWIDKDLSLYSHG